MECIESGTICSKSVKIKEWDGTYWFKKCKKPATYKDKHGNFFCRHHAKVGRFVFRGGDIGKIVARFDTKEELLANRQIYSTFQMQHLSKSSRQTISIPK